MLSKRKGITPVIAIVLLLLITVGAVGVVYTQFQSVVGEQDAGAQAEQQQRMQQSSYDIIGADISGANYNITVKNTGDNTLNLSEVGTVMIGKDGGDPVALEVQGGDDCSLGSISPGATNFCETGVTVGDTDDGASTTIQLKVGQAIKATYTCTERSGQDYC